MFISVSARMLNIVIDAVYFLIKIITMSWLVITQGHKTIAIIAVHAHARGDTRVNNFGEISPKFRKIFRFR